MKTKHLDNEIERLNLMERTEDLSEYGQDMLNEFREIKQALTIPVVVVPKGTFNCGQERVFGGGRCKEQCDDCVFEYQDN